MHSFALQFFFLGREFARKLLRSWILYALCASFLVALSQGWLAPSYLAPPRSVLLVFVVSLLIGTPIGLIAWAAIRLLRFAFSR